MKPIKPQTIKFAYQAGFEDGKKAALEQQGAVCCSNCGKEVIHDPTDIARGT